MVADKDIHALRLYKKQKLCSVIAIGQLFGPGAAADVQSALCFPLRMVWRNNPRRSSDATIQFLISVPKKRVRHAVDRVTCRRRVRECFRLDPQRHTLPDDLRLDVAFIYVGNGTEPYTRIQRAMQRLLKTLNAAGTQNATKSTPDAYGAQSATKSTPDADGAQSGSNGL